MLNGLPVGEKLLQEPENEFARCSRGGPLQGNLTDGPDE